MTNDGLNRSGEEHGMPSMHDHRRGRPGASYGEGGTDASERCPKRPPAPCVTVMEETAHQSARKVLQTLLTVDIDDPESVEAFQNRRRRDADLHRMIDRTVSGTLWGAAKMLAALLIALGLLHVREIAAWFGKP